jgi:hypothetical protein
VLNRNTIQDYAILKLGQLCHNMLITRQFVIVLCALSSSFSEVKLGTVRCRWEKNTEMDLKGVGWEGVAWIHLVQDRDQWRAVMNTVINLRVP